MVRVSCVNNAERPILRESAACGCAPLDLTDLIGRREAFVGSRTPPRALPVFNDREFFPPVRETQSTPIKTVRILALLVWIFPAI